MIKNGIPNDFPAKTLTKTLLTSLVNFCTINPEMISRTLADWAAEHDVTLAFIQPGKPAQNAFIERFNRTYREAVLDAYLFHTVAEVQAISQEWLEEYNAIRPHEALGDVPPYQFASNQS